MKILNVSMNLEEFNAFAKNPVKCRIDEKGEEVIIVPVLSLSPEEMYKMFGDTKWSTITIPEKEG